MIGLDYENSLWVRVYVDDGPDFDCLPWQAKAICMALWRKVNRRTGSIPVGRAGAAAAVSAKTGIPLEVVEAYLPKLVAIEALAVTPRDVSFPEFAAAIAAPMTPAARAKKYRQTKTVTPRDGVVTPRDSSVTGVTPPVTSEQQEKRREEIRGEKREHTHTQNAGAYAGGSPNAASPQGVAPLAPQGPMSPQAEAILAAMHEHSSLLEANGRVANRLWGNVMVKKPLPWVIEAIHSVGRKADLAADAGHPWTYDFTLNKLESFVANAGPPVEPRTNGHAYAPRQAPEPVRQIAPGTAPHRPARPPPGMRRPDSPPSPPSGDPPR